MTQATMSTGLLVASILVMVVATQITRFLPFVLFGRGGQPSSLVLYLGRALPPAILALLVVYCLKEVSLFSYPFGLPELIAGLFVVGIHLWRHNAMLSIFGGTAVYMLLVQLVFVA